MNIYKSNDVWVAREGTHVVIAESRKEAYEEMIAHLKANPAFYFIAMEITIP